MASHVFNSIESQVFVRGDGIDHRVSVRAASTASVNLAANLVSASVDGVTLSAGDRILLKNQSNTAEITTITCVADVADSLDGTYFLLDSASGNQYYVWLNTPAGAGDPGPIGARTGVLVGIATGATANMVASAVRNAIDVLADFSAPVPGANIVTVTDATTGPVAAAVDFGTGFTITRTTRGTSAIDHGIWAVGSGAGTTYRAEDLTASDDASFVMVDVQEGSANAKTQWTCTSVSGMALVGTDSLTWTMSSLFNYAANDLFYGTSGTTIDTLSSVADRVLVTDGSGNISWSDYLPAGININGPFTTGDQIVNKDYVDSVAAGLDPKESVRLRTIDDIGGTYSVVGGTGGTGEFTGVDLTDAGNWDLAVTIAVNDRVLIMNQTDAKQNGIYVITDATGGNSTLERSPDQDGSPSNEVSGGNFTFTETGTVYSGTGWVVVHDGILTLNTDNMNWTQFSTVGSWNAGDGIDIVGNTVSVDLFTDGGLQFTSGELRLDLSDGTIDAGTNPRKVFTTNGSSVVAWRNTVNLTGIYGDSAAEPELLTFTNSNAAVNYLSISNALTGAVPKLNAAGDDANISLGFLAKGTGTFNFCATSAASSEIRMFEDTDNGMNYIGLKSPAMLGVSQTYILPAVDGSANDVLITNGSGVMSWTSSSGTIRQSHSLIALEVKANSTSLSPVGYFCWNNAEYGDVTSGKIFYEVLTTDRTLEIEVFNETTSTSLGSSTHAVSGFFSLSFTLPTANARISVRVRKTSAGGSNPNIFGIQMVFNPAT